MRTRCSLRASALSSFLPAQVVLRRRRAARRLAQSRQHHRVLERGQRLLAQNLRARGSLLSRAASAVVAALPRGRRLAGRFSWLLGRLGFGWRYRPRQEFEDAARPRRSQPATPATRLRLSWCHRVRLGRLGRVGRRLGGRARRRLLGVGRGALRRCFLGVGRAARCCLFGFGCGLSGSEGARARLAFSSLELLQPLAARPRRAAVLLDQGARADHARFLPPAPSPRFHSRAPELVCSRRSRRHLSEFEAMPRTRCRTMIPCPTRVARALQRVFARSSQGPSKGARGFWLKCPRRSCGLAPTLSSARAVGALRPRASAAAPSARPRRRASSLRAGGRFRGAMGSRLWPPRGFHAETKPRTGLGSRLSCQSPEPRYSATERECMMGDHKRASWDEYFMAIAREVATRSTCDENSGRGDRA